LRELNAASHFPDLSWRWYNDIPILKGIYRFKIEYKGIPFQDNFNLVFFFPPDYPETPPLVSELDNKIPATFHHYSNGGLCLCAPVEQYLIFSKDPTLENFIYNLLNPYLLSWLWYERYHETPWGERRHGPMGIAESYQELLKLNDFRHTVFFMGKFLMNNPDRNDDCPCDSGYSYKKCHRKTIIKLENCLPKGQLNYDFKNILLGGLM